jgi:hypothetical protein
LTFVEFFTASFAEDRRPVHIIQSAFDQVGGRAEIFEALLVLNADRCAAELVGDAHGCNIHLTLLKHLRLGEIGFLVLAKVELKPFAKIPIENRTRLVVSDGEHFCIK